MKTPFSSTSLAATTTTIVPTRKMKSREIHAKVDV
jgi:hypothetical protein